MKKFTAILKFKFTLRNYVHYGEDYEDHISHNAFRSSISLNFGRKVTLYVGEMQFSIYIFNAFCTETMAYTYSLRQIGIKSLR